MLLLLMMMTSLCSYQVSERHIFLVHDEATDSKQKRAHQTFFNAFKNNSRDITHDLIGRESSVIRVYTNYRHDTTHAFIGRETCVIRVYD